MENQQNAQVGFFFLFLRVDQSTASALYCVRFVFCVSVVLSNVASGGTDLRRSNAVNIDNLARVERVLSSCHDTRNIYFTRSLNQLSRNMPKEMRACLLASRGVCFHAVRTIQFLFLPSFFSRR